jgi:hypothetical protein
MNLCLPATATVALLAPPGCGGGSDSDSGADADSDTDVGVDSDTDTDTDSDADGCIAARHPGDVGIADDPHVIFADDFEGYGDASELGARWNAGVYNVVRLAREPENVHSGSQSVEFTSPERDDELSNTVARQLDEELDVLYLRFYSRFGPDFDIWGSSHNGGGLSAHYFVDGAATPGIPADGYNKFLMEWESWRGEQAEPNPGLLNVYIYHPEQRSRWGDHFFPDGTVLPFSYQPGDFGDDFVPRDDVVVELGRWYCYEIMLRANTPGERDGRITLWLDGEVFADFGNLRLRDTADLRIDRFNLSLHAGANPSGETHKHYDDVVAATSCIGPRVE